jgi:hypothetical protein
MRVAIRWRPGEAEAFRVRHVGNPIARTGESGHCLLHFVVAGYRRGASTDVEP